MGVVGFVSRVESQMVGAVFVRGYVLYLILRFVAELKILVCDSLPLFCDIEPC